MEITTFRRSEKSCLSPIQIDSPDVQLVPRFQEGDSEVFNLLYRRYRSKKWIATAIEIPHRIYGVICSIISNPDDALALARTFFSKHIKPSGISRELRNSTVGSTALQSIAA